MYIPAQVAAPVTERADLFFVFKALISIENAGGGSVGGAFRARPGVRFGAVKGWESKWFTDAALNPGAVVRLPAVENPDAAEFARERLGFEPDEKQAEVLRSEAKRGILNCTRQWGKSTVAAAKAVHRAYTRPGSLVLVASPAERQSGEFLRKAAEMLARLGIAAAGDGDNAISLLLPNGSRIVGLPGTEATVRGFSAVSLLLIDEASRVEDRDVSRRCGRCWRWGTGICG